MPAIPAIIAGGSAIAGSAIAAHGNTSAAKTQAGSDAAALAQAKEIYQQQRADQGPYRESGYGAMDALNFGLGLPAVSRLNATAAAPTTNQVTPLTVAGVGGDPTSNMPNMNALGKSVAAVNQANAAMNSGQLGPTTKVSKGGVTRVIPTSLLQKALGDGYQQVQ